MRVSLHQVMNKKSCHNIIAGAGLICLLMASVANADEISVCEERDYRPLAVANGDLRPFAEQHDIYAYNLPWFDPAGRDLVCEGSCFGSAPLLYRFLRVDGSVPVYAPGVPCNRGGYSKLRAVART